MSGQCLHVGWRVVREDVEQHQRRAVRAAVAAFPVSQGGGGETKTGCELLLGHAQLGAHGLYVDLARAMHAHAAFVALGVSDGLLQALLDTNRKSTRLNSSH